MSGVGRSAGPLPARSAAGIDRVLRSAWNFHLNFGMNFIILLGAASAGALRFRGDWGAAIAAAASGFISWTLIEYALHRWIFHSKSSPAARGHALHHREPRALIAVPFLTGFAVAVLLWFGLKPFLSEATVLFYISGMTVGYTSYGLLHYLIHHVTFRVSWLAALQRHHEAHHRHPRANFGITTTYLDRLLGTLREP